LLLQLLPEGVECLPRTQLIRYRPNIGPLNLLTFTPMTHLRVRLRSILVKVTGASMVNCRKKTCTKDFHKCCMTLTHHLKVEERELQVKTRSGVANW